MTRSFVKLHLGVVIALFIVSAVGLFVPQVAHAASFVQCGNQDGGQLDANGHLPGCTLYDLFSTAARIINYLFTAAGIVAVAGVLYGAGLKIMSMGSESRNTAGNKAIFNSLIGLAIVLLSILIVQSVLTILRFKGNPKDIITNPTQYFQSSGSTVGQ